jgi:peptidyl-prolyl cis-trans isomerase C
VVRTTSLVAVVMALSLMMTSGSLFAEEAPATKAAAAKTDPATVIASAGKVQVTAGDFEEFLAGLPPQQQAQIAADAEGRRQVADHLVKMKAILTEAESRKLDADPKVKAQIDDARRRVLIQALLASMQGDEAADKKYFEEHKEELGKVKARHILVSTKGSNDPANAKPKLTDEEAKKKADGIRARLAKGEDFAAIAKTESDDPGSKETGGEYTFGRGMMVPEFEDVAFSLKENEISQPVKTEHGYHVIQLQQRIAGTYEEAKAQIPRQRVESLIKELTGGEKTKFNEEFLGAGAPPVAAAPAPATPAPAPAVPAPEKK